MSKFASQVSITKSEIAFVDPGVSHLDMLLAHLRPDVDAIVLDRARPAPAQMAETLRQRSSVAAVHVIAHGHPGELSFTSGAVSLDSLDAGEGDFAAIGRALRQDGALLLWSCNSGAGEAGSAFVERLENATGTAVAAASRTIGAGALGGCWQLDTHSRAIDAAAPLTAEGIAAYPELLGPPTPPGSGQIIVIHNGVATGIIYSSIKAAITAASAFDTIEIGAGTYDENVNVNKNGLTIENAPGAQITILGQGGYAGALNVASGVFGVTIQSSDGVPGNFVVEGSLTSPQVTALYIVGQNDDITINGVTTVAPVTGDAGLNSVLTGGNLNNVLFENNVFTGNAEQLVYVNGAEDYGPSGQDGLVSFVGNTFSGSATGPLLGMDAPGEIINNTFSGSAAVDIGLGEAGVTVSGNTFSTVPADGYFFGNGAYDPKTIQANNSFPQQGMVYIIHNGVPQDGVYTSIQDAIDAADAGDTIVAGPGVYTRELNVDKSLTIEGANFGVAGTGTRGAETDIAGGMIISADNVTINGVQINGSFDSVHQFGTDYPNGVWVEGNSVTIENSVFTGEGAAVDSRPFSTEGGITGFSFTNNAVIGWQEGAYIVNGGAGTISNDTFTNDGNGVVTESVGMVISSDSFQHSGMPPYGIGSDIATVGNQSNVDLGTFIGPNDTFSAGDTAQLSVYLNATGPVTVTNDTGINAHIHSEYATGPVTYIGGTASDTITGTSLNDTFNVGSGNDSIDGGAGTDTVKYDVTVTTSDITIVNGQWQVSDGTHGTDTLNNVEKVTDGTHTFLLVGDGGFATIQDAVNAASAGDTILIAPGSQPYAEQVMIGSGLDGLTIESVGSGVTVESPNTLKQTAFSLSGRSIDSIFTVNGSNNVTIEGLTVDGQEFGNESHFFLGQNNPELVGITYLNSDGGVVNDVTVTGTREADAGLGDQRNLGILVENTQNFSGDIPAANTTLNSISITGSTIENFQKGGIVVVNADATISGNTLHGIADVPDALEPSGSELNVNAQNAVQIEGSTGTISDNIIDTIGTSSADAATGVLAFDNNGLDITGNTFTGALDPNTNGVPLTTVGFFVLDSINGQITGNSSTNVDDGIAVESDQFGDDTTGTWTLSGNTATNVVSLANGGNGIFFDADPTNSSSSFTINDSGSNTSDAFFLTPGTDTLTGGDAGNNSFVLLNSSDLGAGDTINGGKGTGNTIDFASGMASATLSIGSNVTNVQEVDIVGPTFLSTDTTQLNVNATNASNGLTIAANNGGDTITGTAHFNDTLIGGTGADTFIVGTGNDSISGGAGIDTVKGFGAGFTISISNGHWVVGNGTTTDTLSGVEDVVINGKTYELVDKYGTTGGFQSLQAAIDSASIGTTILVAPGTYVETANYGADGADDGTGNPMGLLIDKSVTIEGVNSSGHVITSASNTQATIVSSTESGFGTNFYVTAPNVTISGLAFQATDLEYGQNPENTGVVNKAIEDVANNFTLENSLVGAESGVPLGSSVYIDELTIPTNPDHSPDLVGFTSTITQYNVTSNILAGDFVEASGVGFGHPSDNLSLQFTNNEFSLNVGTTVADYVNELGGANLGIVLEGDLYPTVGWDLAPVADPTITGNTVDADYTESPSGARLLAWDNSAANLPSLSYIQNYVANNTLGTYAYDLTSGGALDIQSSSGTSYYYVYIDAGDASGGATAGDTVIVQSASDSSVQTIQTDDLTIKALPGSTALDLSLGNGVASITLADYSAGHGANVTVSGNGSGDTISGNDGSDTLNGGAGNDTFIVGSGNNSIDGGAGTDTFKYDGTVSTSDLTIVGGKWQVSDGADGTDSLNNVEKVTDGAHNIWLVGDGGFTTIQQAVDAASAGDTIMIAPGTYNAGATIGKALTIVGAGDTETIINTGASSDGLNLTGSIGSGATVSISGIGLIDNQDGIDVHSSTVLGNLVINNDDFEDSIISGVGMGSGAPTLSSISITNSTFTQNGNGSESGDGDISLFGFLGNATLQNLVVNGGPNTVPMASGNADYGIQIAGFDSSDNVTHPIGTVVFDNVQVNGTYDKASIGIQGYTDLNGLSFENTGHGGTVIDGHDGFGEGLYIDVTADMTPVTTINGNHQFLTTGAVAESVNLTNVSVTNGTVNSATVVPLGTFFKGTPENDTISGLSGGNNLILGLDGVDTVEFTEALTVSDFSFNATANAWVVTTVSEGTDILQGVELVTDASHTYLLVGAGGNYQTPDQAFTSAQYASGDIIVDTSSQDEVPTLSFNASLVGKAGAGSVSFTVASLDDDASGTATFKDKNGATVQVPVASNGIFTANLSSLADGTITGALSISDSAGNQQTVSAGNSLTLDQDIGEQALLSLTVGNTDVGKSAASTVPFTIAGLDSEDTGTVTFTDSAHNTVPVSVNGGQTTYSADLHTLADGTITSSLQVNADPAGNSFTAVSGTTITLDQDLTENPTLSFVDTLIGGPNSTAVKSTVVHFSVRNIDSSDDTAVVTFTDVNSKHVTATETADNTFTVDLSSLADGTVTASMSVTDPAGNVFNVTSSNTATLEQDSGEQAALKLIVSDTHVSKSKGAESTVPFAIAGLESGDIGTVTFTDSTNKTVRVNVSSTTTSYTADLSSLTDGTITSSLQVNADTAGNSFAAVSGASIVLNQSGAPDSSIAITSGLSHNDPTAGTPLQADVSFTSGNSATTPITYAWFVNGSQVQNGSSSTYTPTEANLGLAITVQASFTDLFGDAVVESSAATGGVLDAAPTVTTPIIAGIAQVGKTLTASATATPADDTLSFEWFSSADNFSSPIATGSTFKVTATGVSLEVEAIAANANGVQTTATSAAIATAAAPPPAINFPHVAGSNVDEWILASGQWTASAEPGSIPSGYAVAGIGDFTGSGTSDILWQNSTTGDTQEWMLNNGAYNGTVDLGAHPGSFKIAGVGDFTGNGIDDVLWTSSTSSGVQTDIWELSSSGQWQASVSPGTHPAGYNVVGVGDFTGNGTSDILWQNSTTGDVDEWQIADGQWSASVDLGSHPGTGWTIAGMGDFTGNGIDDILWTDSSGGQVQTDIWELGSNGQWLASVSPGTHPAGYQVAAVGNFADTGTDGILWFNASTGDTDEWEIAKGQWAASVDLGAHGGQLAGAGAFVGGNATSDVLWQNKT